jgi:hypothetical protein
MARLREAKLAAAVYVVIAINKRRKVERKRWVKNWVRRRDRQLAYTQFISEMQLEDAQQFRHFTRMSAVEVQSLVNMLGPVIGKQDTAIRNAISLDERVILTRCTFSYEFISLRLSLTCFDQVTVHNQQFCTSSLQHFTVHSWRSLFADTIICNVPATRNALLGKARTLFFLTYVYHDARFGGCNCAVCLMAACVVKQVS